jgi:hypothetical protein
MKNYQSIVEGTWIEKNPFSLTIEEKTLLTSNEEVDLEAKLQLINEIKSRSEVSVVSPKLEVLTVFYTNIKTSLRLIETDTYQLISLNLTEKYNGVFSGILNCKVNTEHKQVRF